MLVTHKGAVLSTSSFHLPVFSRKSLLQLKDTTWSFSPWLLLPMGVHSPKHAIILKMGWKDSWKIWLALQATNKHQYIIYVFKYTHTPPYIKWEFMYFEESVFVGTALVILHAWARSSFKCQRASYECLQQWIISKGLTVSIGNFDWIDSLGSHGQFRSPLYLFNEHE